MSKTTKDTEFETQTKTFMKTYAVYPQDYSTNRDTNIAPSEVFDKKIRESKTDDLLTITKRTAMIAYTKLGEIPFNVFGNKKNAYQLFFFSKNQIKGPLDDYVETWFLPWASNRLTSITIPAKLNQGPGPKVPDPDLFFTAAINGCSVQVHGDPKNPTVTHGGTTDPRATKFTTTATDMFGAKTETPNNEHFTYGNAKLHWKELHNNYYGGAPGINTLAGIHTGDYRNYLGLDNTPEAIQYRKFLDDNSGKSLRIEDVAAQGSVFGLRGPTGNWSFYLQKNVEIRITKLKKKKGFLKSSYVPSEKGYHLDFGGGAGKDGVAVEEVQISIPINVVRFFPGGIRPDQGNVMLDPSTVKMMVQNAVL